ncbi:MAG: GGDEF domain-containing protein [Terracidiphilus sp.]|jgi:diguanylate cyclase (GGDEF)-like protein
MKRLIPVVALILGWSSATSAAAPAVLTTLRAVHHLNNSEASQELPVAFEATVTFFRGSERTLFVQDGDVAIYVRAGTDAKLSPGDRVLIQGKTHPDFQPDVVSDRITFLHHGTLPKPVPATFDELISTRRDCMLVTVRGVVRAVDLQRRRDVRNPSLPMHTLAHAQLLMDGGYIEAFIDSDDASALSDLLDAEVEVTGAAGESFDGKLQPTGADIDVSSLADVKVIKRAETNPWSLPVTPMNQVLTGYHVNDLTQRVRVHGTITYYHPGSAAVLQDGASSMWIATQTRSPLQVGDQANAIGFPDTHNGLLALTRAEIQDSHVLAPINPLQVTWKQLTTSGNIYDLVSIEGRVVTAVREASQDEYVLDSGGHLFTAIYRHPEFGLLPMKQIPLGASVRVTGICVLEDANPFDGEVPFDILLRTIEDIAVVAKPSPLNIQNLILVVCALVLMVFAMVARGWVLERKVRRQTSTLAYIEQWRSRILEDINGTRPLAEIVEEIANLVSYKLDGAPCWCQIADGAQLGNCPPGLASLRIAKREIPARSGPPLGAIFAAFEPHIKPCVSEAGTLSMAAGLATLAIETRRLYSDLLHRSEFDLLTDIHNRFSLEKCLDAQIEEARASAGIFGLIYIDLDEFKQVNDLFGHHVGDLYLQEVTLRMKQQLRSHDLLARLGGDEFAVLLPLVRNRAGVEEIAQRLEACFNDPLVLEGHTLEGSASFGIALYPEDSATGDGLLSAADAAMYAAKNSKRQVN